MGWGRCAGAVVLAGLLGGQAMAAPIIFDDFNVNEGHFGFAVNFSPTTVGENAALSSADRVTDVALEGAGSQKLTLVHDGTTTGWRYRHVSGGPPYNSTTAAAPAGNITFITSAGVDGYIGFYLKTSDAVDWFVGLNLDDATNTGAGMDMGKLLPVIGDGQWHLYEWNLDDDDDWDPVIGIGGNGTIEHGQHSIDSIYFFNGRSSVNIYLDFVAKSDSGSIAALVPEPGCAGLICAGAVALLGRRRQC